MCAAVGVIVSLFTKSDSSQKLVGLTVYDVHKLKSIFKGSDVNEEVGECPVVNWKLESNDLDELRFSSNDMKLMKANPGDLVYIQDARWWLGGLKSAHSTYGKPHNEDGVVYINSSHLEHGQFVEGLSLRAEKEM